MWDTFSGSKIGYHTGDGNLEGFFQHKNLASSPFHSNGGNLHLGRKSDLLIYMCMEGLYETQTEAPLTSSIINCSWRIQCQDAEPVAVKKASQNTPLRFHPFHYLAILQHTMCLDFVWDRYI